MVGRGWVIAAALAATAAAAYGTSLLATPSRGGSLSMARSGVPPEFRHACGHPDATVRLHRLPVTVDGSACDLTGVTVRYGEDQAQVLPSGEGGVGVFADWPAGSHHLGQHLDITTTPSGMVRITGY